MIFFWLKTLTDGDKSNKIFCCVFIETKQANYLYKRVKKILINTRSLKEHAESRSHNYIIYLQFAFKTGSTV